MLTLKLPSEGKDQHDRKHGQADDDVACMQADQRVERGAKEVGADGQPIVIDQLIPFEPGAAEKDRAQNYGERPPQAEGPHRAFLQGPFRYPDGEAAREQAYRVKDGKLQNLARLRPGDALAYVIDIGNHKNSEDRRLGNDQGRHGDGAVIGQAPSLRWLPGEPGESCSRSSSIYPRLDQNHSYRESGSSGCFRSHNGLRLATTGALAKLYSGGGDEVAHSSVQASQGSGPASGPLKYEYTML